jgi:hypothetical protein
MKKNEIDIQHCISSVLQESLIESGLGRAATKAKTDATAKRASLENMVTICIRDKQREEISKIDLFATNPYPLGIRIF